VVLLVDECSLVSCELMSELNSALCFVKEKPDQWFGGITVIFAGDFYQYPPVGGTALYTLISAYSTQSNEEINKRLGRMAWKTVNTVVSLTEQEHMKGDPEYGAAVQCLRTRECTFEDVEFFNSRVIKLATKEDGVDMSKAPNFSAAAIVCTNLLHETLNMRKAQANSNSLHRQLIVCAAMDKCAGRNLNHHD
jgi:PIF1-like helicase